MITIQLNTPLVKANGHPTLSVDLSSVSIWENGIAVMVIGEPVNKEMFSARLMLVPIQNVTALFCDEDILK